MDAETSKKQEKERLNTIPKGKPKSGRTWKMNKGRYSAISRPKSIKLTYEERMKKKSDLNETRNREKQMWNVVNEKRDKLKERQKENKERRLANERKGEVLQIIKNPAKLKRMKKKQLRSIQKRDLDKIKNKKASNKMYNGIGIQTARGTGTNGYVQKNLSFVPTKRERVEYVKDADIKKLETLIEKKGNAEILEHEKKRRIEVKCMEMRDMMLNNGYDEEVTNEKVRKFREVLMEREGPQDKTDIEYDDFGRPISKETHQLAQANDEKNRRLREAFGIGEFDRKKAAERKAEELKEAERRKAELANKNYAIVQDDEDEDDDEEVVEKEPPKKEKEKKKDKEDRHRHKSRDEKKRKPSPEPTKERSSHKHSKKHRRERSDDEDESRHRRRRERSE